MNNKTIKLHALIFTLGLSIGFFVCYYVFVQKRPIKAVISTSISSIEKNSEEIKEDPKTEITTNKNEIQVNTTVNTPYYGNIETETILDRRLLQYSHGISLGANYLLNTKTVLGSVGYSYKNFGIDLFGGYSFEINKFEVGIGVKYIFKF